MKKPIQYPILLILAFLLLAGAICILPMLYPADPTPTEPSAPPASTQGTTTAPTTEATTPPTTEAPPPPTTVPPLPSLNGPVSVTAKNAFIYHCDRNYTSYIKTSGDAVMYPASITKLFSVYVALQHLDPAQTVTVGRIILTVPPDSSFAQLEEGDVLTVKDLVAAMMLPSGGDAARVMAVAAGRAIAKDPSLPESEAMARFITEMNAEAQRQGMTGTHFVNPDGYHHEDHYTCLQDLLTIGKLSLETDLIRQITSTTEYTVTPAPNRTLTWKNTNLLLQESVSEFYCAAAIGLKTGYTGAAGSCLMAAFEKDGEYVLIGIFGSETKQSRFSDALTLFNALQ